jgi:two-component system, cell cycle sensor histidine kinase and response regulator CckA
MSESGEPRLNARAHGEAEERRRVLQLARRLSATLGVDFFHSLVKNLSDVLNVDCAYLGELPGTANDRLRSLAVIRDGNQSGDFEQRLSGTACGQVLSDGVFACSKDVLRIFPLDTHLHGIGAEGYAGIRLSDSAGQPLGVLAIASKEPLFDVPLAKSVLGTFAPRVGAEIERKRNDDRHRESEERYHAFIASNPDAMWRLEFGQPVSLDQPEEELIEQLYRSGYLAECNDALAKLFGRERTDQLLGLPFETFVPRSDVTLQEDLRSAIRSRFQSTIVERVLSDENGCQRYRLRSQFGIVEHGELRRLWGNTRDITELRRAELSAAASERRFREVLEGIQLPALILDEHGAITFCNESFLRLTQRSRAEVGALTWMDGVISSAQAEIWKAAMSPERPGDPARHFEGEIAPRDKSLRRMTWDTICLRNQDNQVAALAAIGRDLTYQKGLEAQVRQAQKLDGIGRLAAGIAHDFNNLLTIVLGRASQLLDEVSESDRAYASLSQVVHAATQCAQLTEHLMALSRRQLIRPQLINLNKVIDDVRGLLRSMAGSAIMLNIERAPQLPEVLADPTQMQEVLSNLVTNARDAMPNGGSLTIATANAVIVDEDPDYPGINPGSYVRLLVIDSGLGLADEVQAHVFEPFFTTKAPGKGTGLGLSTVYAIVKQSGGHITVRSVLHRGTTFEILLPAPPPVVH